MERNVTLRQVAEESGVARGTVSNVLNHPDRVSPELTRRVREAMERLDFVRNESARQLRSGRSTQVGFSLIDSWNPFFNDVTRGAEVPIYGAGLSLSVSSSAFDRDRERATLAALAERRVAGVLAVSISRDSVEQLAQMRQRGISCVLVDRAPEGLPVPAHSVDEVHGGWLVGRHLSEIGRTKIAFCGNPSVHAHASQRLDGLRSGGADGVDIELVEVDALTVAAGLRAGEKLLARDRRHWPDAIFGVNDLVAIGIIQTLTRAGVSVPDQIAVVGFDDIEFASQIAIPLTTVRQPGFEMGEAAATLLLDDIQSEAHAEPQHIVHIPTLVVRESTIPVV